MSALSMYILHLLGEHILGFDLCDECQTAKQLCIIEVEKDYY